jgi:hypothetical protein
MLCIGELKHGMLSGLSGRSVTSPDYAKVLEGWFLAAAEAQASAREEGKTRIDKPVQDDRDSAVGEEPGPCRSLSSPGAGAAKAA